MPNPPRPPALKAIAGTDRRDRASPPQVELPKVEQVPPAPDWMPNVHAVNEWNRLAAILVANGLLTEGGTGVLAVLCALHGKIQQLYAAGESPTGHMIAQYRALANDFGLTPVAQGKVRQSEAGVRPGNRFANNGKRSA
jgi:phage terminase small subunit